MKRIRDIVLKGPTQTDAVTDLRNTLKTFEKSQLRERIATHLVGMHFQDQETLLDTTDARFLQPPVEQEARPQAARDDWNRIDEENTCLVSQRLLKSYQKKRQLLRNDQHERETNYRNSLKTEYLGYRRFSPLALKIEHETLERNMKAVREKMLTPENRELG